MKRPRSPTLLSYILLGFIVVALPLVAAIVTAIVRVDRLAYESRIDMMAVQQNAVASRGLVERATSMERSARQYKALQDPSFKRLYEEHRDGARALLDQLAAQAQSAQMSSAVAGASRSERRVTELLDTAIGTIVAEELESRLDALRRDATAVVREQNAISRATASVLPDKAKDLQRALLLQAVLVIPVSVGLAAILFFVIAPPLRQIGQSIQALGRGALGEPIRIQGARDLEELGQRLEWLRNRLVELEAQKSQFLRNVSHELKTPLTNIREGAELLLEDSERGAPNDRAVIACIVQSNSVRLQQMIEALLRYGAEGDLAAGQLEVPVRLDHLVLELVERHSLDAAAHSVRIEHSLQATTVVGNPKRLQVIVENLLSNALKYTPQGGRIEVRLRQRDGHVELDVQDSGPGVAEEDRGRMFDWFYSGRRPPGSIVAGSGMGLAIAQEYAEQHDGRIELLPTTAGAHFRFTLRKKA
ncbi:MAG: ATP-binding protein [Xanthomonadales bacterium]|nr:ATP-binding protein [Xanthomonadales bacterium]